MDLKQKLLVGAGVAALGGLVYYLTSNRRGRKSSSSQSRSITVTQLWTYPIKSCSGMALTTADLDQYGFLFDREWVIARDLAAPKNIVVTQRENQRMKLITASILPPTGSGSDARPGSLVLNAEGHDEVRLPIDDRATAVSLADPSQLVELEKWDLKGKFIREPEVVNKWLSAVLEEPVFLARCIAPRDPTQTKYQHLMKSDDRILGHDFSTLHVISEEGLAWIRKQSDNPMLNSARFRPNIVVAGTSWPEEDNWLEFTVGPAKIRTTKLCSRCSIPTIDDKAKMARDFQPTATLKDQHSKPSLPDDPSSSPKAMFGLNCFHEESTPVQISLGDVVTVTKVRGGISK